MATEDSFIQAGHGIGSRDSSRMLSVLTVNGASTVKGPITVPPGAWLNAIAIETPTTITGTPTCNVRVGTTDGGQDIVADTAAQTQGHVAATIVTAAHEMCHLRQEMIGDKSHHGAKFKRMATQVCRAHGFDLKTF